MLLYLKLVYFRRLFAQYILGLLALKSVDDDEITKGWQK